MSEYVTYPDPDHRVQGKTRTTAQRGWKDVSLENTPTVDFGEISAHRNVVV
jgi:hypothetical protein